MPRLNRHVKIWSILGSLVAVAVVATFSPAEGTGESPSGEPVWARPTDVGPDSWSTSEDGASLDDDGTSSLAGPPSADPVDAPPSRSPDEGAPSPPGGACPELGGSGALHFDVAIDVDGGVEGGTRA